MRRGRDRLAQAAGEQIRAASVPLRCVSPQKSPKKAPDPPAQARSPRKPPVARKTLTDSPRKTVPPKTPASPPSSPVSPPAPPTTPPGDAPAKKERPTAAGEAASTLNGSLNGSKRTVRSKTSSPPRRESSMLKVCKHPYDQDIREVQAAIGHYRYNMNGPTYDVSKDRPLSELCETAEEILLCPEQPIQCVEAAFLGIHLTQGMDVVRFPMSFRSKAWKEGFGPFPDTPGGVSQGSPMKAVLQKKRKADENDDDDGSPKLAEGEKEYEIINHLVIGLYKRGFFGAIGISRNPGLHSKPMTFTSFSDMIWDYSQHYRKDRHVLLSVRLGDAIEHTPTPETYTPLWRRIEIKLSRWHVAEQRLYQFQEQLIASSKKAGCYARPPVAQEGKAMPLVRPPIFPTSPPATTTPA